MHIETFQDTIRACRFCFMCRHLSATANVTYREADTPRGLALIIDKITQQPALLQQQDYQNAIYDATLSAACRTHCVSHYDETGLLLAARRDIVESGKIPASIQKLADRIRLLKLEVKGDANAQVVYYVDRYTECYHPEIAAAMEKILKAAGVNFQVVSGADTGKALAVLGFWDAAKKAAGDFAKVVSGKKVIITSCPAAYDSLKNDYPKYGVDVGGDVQIRHTSEFLLTLVTEGKLKLRAQPGATLFHLDSDYLRNYNKGFSAPKELASAAGITLQPFGANQEESYTAGEAGVIMDELSPVLVEKLVRRIEQQVDNIDQDTLLAMSPYTKYVLRKFAQKDLRLTTVEEIIAKRI